MIKFVNLHAEGFGSFIEPVGFNLDQPGLNVIRGKVGSGKTHIPAALSWCLFGKHLKEKASVQTWEEKRPESWRGTQVQTSFFIGENDYTIIRCLNFKGKVGNVKGNNGLFILENGLPVKPEEKGKVALQKYIEDLIGYSFELFKSSIVFGQKMKKIIEESGPQKKKIFEEAFEVAFIEEAKDNTKEELAKLKHASQNIEATIDTLLDKISDQEAFYEDALDHEQNFENEKRAQIKEIKQDKKTLKEEIKDIEKNSNIKLKRKPSIIQYEIKKLEDQKDLALKKEYKIDSSKVELADIKAGITEIQNELAKKEQLCPTCGKPMGQNDMHKHRKKLRKELKELQDQETEIEESIKNYDIGDIPGLKDKIKDLRKEKAKIDKKVTQAKEQKKRIPKIKKKLTELDKRINKLEKKKLEVKSTIYKRKIRKLETRLKKQKSEQKRIQGHINLKEWLIKDPLSNNGLKAYMFSSMLKEVNIALEEYSRILGFQVEFGIDLSTHRKDFYQAIEYDGVIIPYEDLSGGQKQLVDTSVAFAIHDVISKIRPTNILFMDEPFESLGTDEIEIIEELVEQKSKDKSLYLITHHESFNPRNVNDIFVKREKSGNSQIS